MVIVVNKYDKMDPKKWPVEKARCTAALLARRLCRPSAAPALALVTPAQPSTKNVQALRPSPRTPQNPPNPPLNPLAKQNKEQVVEDVRANLRHVNWASVVCTVATRGRRVEEVVDAIVEAGMEHRRRARGRAGGRAGGGEGGREGARIGPPALRSPACRCSALLTASFPHTLPPFQKPLV